MIMFLCVIISYRKKIHEYIDMSIYMQVCMWVYYTFKSIYLCTYLQIDMNMNRNKKVDCTLC